jgi:hypothetical protein
MHAITPNIFYPTPSAETHQTPLSDSGHRQSRKLEAAVPGDTLHWLPGMYTVNRHAVMVSHMGIH